jgi:hypothetical protein
MKIFVYAYNRPDFLKYQNLCLRKFIKEEFEFYCIDNSKDQKIENELKLICNENKINYVRNLKPDHSLEGRSHYAAMQWSWDNIISNTNEIIVMIDHDNFPIKEASILDILGDAVIAGVPQAREHVEYISPSFMIFNTSIMPNKNNISFNGSRIEEQNTDIGGELYFYFKQNPNVKLNKLPCGPIEPSDPIISKFINGDNYPHTFDLICGSFVHPRNGSNWARLNKNELINRDNLIFSILNERI